MAPQPSRAPRAPARIDSRRPPARAATRCATLGAVPWCARGDSAGEPADQGRAAGWLYSRLRCPSFASIEEWPRDSSVCMRRATSAGGALSCTRRSTRVQASACSTSAAGPGSTSRSCSSASDRTDRSSASTPAATCWPWRRRAPRGTRTSSCSRGARPSCRCRTGASTAPSSSRSRVRARRARGAARAAPRSRRRRSARPVGRRLGDGLLARLRSGPHAASARGLRSAPRAPLVAAGPHGAAVCVGIRRDPYGGPRLQPPTSSCATPTAARWSRCCRATSPTREPWASRTPTPGGRTSTTSRSAGSSSSPSRSSASRRVH